MQVWDTMYNLKNNYSDMESQWFVLLQVNLTW